MRPTVELALVVGHVGLTGDRRGSAVRQRASHLLGLGRLCRAVHAVELSSTWEETPGGSRESFNKSGEVEEKEEVPEQWGHVNSASFCYIFTCNATFSFNLVWRVISYRNNPAGCRVKKKQKVQETNNLFTNRFLNSLSTSTLSTRWVVGESNFNISIIHQYQHLANSVHFPLRTAAVHTVDYNIQPQKVTRTHTQERRSTQYCASISPHSSCIKHQKHCRRQHGRRQLMRSCEGWREDHPAETENLR